MIFQPEESWMKIRISDLRGIGSERAEQFRRLGIEVIQDLLLHRPRRYEDRRHLKTIKEITFGEQVTTRGVVRAAGVKTWARRTKSVFELIIEDGTGRLYCRWWNMPFVQKFFQVGDELLVFGKTLGKRPLTIDHPETEILDVPNERFIHLDRIVPIYPSTEGLSQRTLRAMVWLALERFSKEIDALLDPCPDPGFPGLGDALKCIHFPHLPGEVASARKKLALIECFHLQKELLQRRRNLTRFAQAEPCTGTNELVRKFLPLLPFALTPSQTKVLKEIRADLCLGTPMRRLLQGDVGSGKTLVAACSALMVMESGMNVALMAPTQILAEQHFRTLQTWFSPLGIIVLLVTGERTLEESQVKRAAGTESAIFVGTHALLEGKVQMERLGLVVIDEQHKFGVTQREKLVRKGKYPHLLVMTATPIPRTLGLTVYGDLDISVIDLRPEGRAEIQTFLRKPEKLPQIWEFIRSQLVSGRQAYVVYSRVEEDQEEADLKGVKREGEKLRVNLAPFEVAVLHGTLPAEEKEQIMEKFRLGKIHVLVASSVIEVGIDVPNATVMVIENAERFGMAQLHQLRGRVGRGEHKSFCILVGDPKTEEAAARLKVVEKTRDGFKIAEEDLKLRGAGNLLGQEQSGSSPLIYADLDGDFDLLVKARELAAKIIS